MPWGLLWTREVSPLLCVLLPLADTALGFQRFSGDQRHSLKYRCPGEEPGLPVTPPHMAVEKDRNRDWVSQSLTEEEVRTTAGKCRIRARSEAQEASGLPIPCLTSHGLDWCGKGPCELGETCPPAQLS